MKKILLIGGGGHCKSVIDVIELEGKYEIAGIIDTQDLVGSSVLSYRVIGSDDDLKELHKEFSYAFITVGHIKSNNLRIKLFNLLKAIGFEVPIIISPLAYVSKHTSISEGTIVMHHALINSAVTIEKNCIINTKSLCEHDSTIGEHSHISTGAIINGGAVVDKNTFVGSGAIVVQQASVSGFIKAGSINK